MFKVKHLGRVTPNLQVCMRDQRYNIILIHAFLLRIWNDFKIWLDWWYIVWRNVFPLSVFLVLCFEFSLTQIIQIYYFQVFWVLFVSFLFLLVPARLEVLDKVPQDSYFFMEVADKVEVVDLPKPELAIVVIQALFRYTYNFRCFLQIQTLLLLLSLSTVKFSPFFDNLNNLLDSPLPTLPSLDVSISRLFLFIFVLAGIVIGGSWFWGVPYQYNRRFEIVFIEGAVLALYFVQSCEFISDWVVDGGDNFGFGAVLLEYWVDWDLI